MSKININKHRTLMTVLSVMIGRCSPAIQQWRPVHHTANVGSSNFSYTGKSTSIGKKKKWSKEDSQHVIHWYVKSSSIQRAYRKQMMELREKSTNTTSQNLADEQISEQ